MTAATQVGVTSAGGQGRATVGRLGSLRREIDGLFEGEPRGCRWAVRGVMSVESKNVAVTIASPPRRGVVRRQRRPISRLAAVAARHP